MASYFLASRLILIANEPLVNTALYLVVLTRFNKELKEEETLQILNKGDIFGDSEVLEQTMRTATVTTALDAMFWSVEGQVSQVITCCNVYIRCVCFAM